MRSAIASLLLFAFCLVSTAQGGGRLSALSGSGYSLSFQGLVYSTDIATLASDFNCSDGNNVWPKNEATVSFWAKCGQANTESNGISCRSMIFFQGYVESTAEYVHMISPILSTSVTTFSLAVKGVTQTATSKVPKIQFDMFSWRNYVYVVVNNSVTVYIDGALYGTVALGVTAAATAPFDFCAAPAGGHRFTSTSLNIGRNFFRPSTYPYQEASGQSYQGQFDEISFWNRSLTQQEIEGMLHKKLAGDEQGLVLYYDFNQPSSKVAKNLASTGSAYDLLLGRTQGTQVIFDVSTNQKYISTAPLFAPSTVPLDVSNDNEEPHLCFPVPKAAELYPLEFTRPIGTDLQIVSLPSSGTLYNTADGVNSTGQLNVGDLITHPNGAILYSAAVGAIFAKDSFLFSINGTRNATVELFVSGAPKQPSPTLTASSGLTTFISTGVVDPLGTAWKKTFVDFPLEGQFYQVSLLSGAKADPINSTSPKITHPGGYIAYVAPQVISNKKLNFSVMVTNEAGVSSVSAMALNVVPVPALPVVTSFSYDVDQSSATGVPVELRAHDDNQDILGITISELPKHGKLYLSPDGVTRGPEITYPFNPYDLVTANWSYATRVVAASSWYGGGTDYSPWQTLGPQNVFVAKDSPLASSFKSRNGLMGYNVSFLNNTWAGNGTLTSYYDPDNWFDNEGYTEFYEWEFGEPVYALDLYVGICRGQGTPVKVKAWAPNQRWQTIWSGVVDTTIPATTYQQFFPNLCQTTFRTNRLRVEFNTRTSDWSEIDYVRFNGAQNLRVAVLEWNMTTVIYVPDERYVGNDSFTFTANDCPYDRLHSATVPGRISITVNERPQPPVVNPVVTTTGAGDATALELDAYDVNNAPITHFTIVTLPQIGKLVVDGKTINSVPFSFSGQGLTYKPDLYQWRGETNVSFNYTAATSEQEAVGSQTAWILLEEPADENSVPAWIALFLIIVFCSACFFLLMSRYDKHPLRTLSLVLCLTITCATALTVNIPLSIILFNSRYSCGFYYWSYMLFPPLFFLAIVISIYRQHFMFRLERVKKKISRDGRHEDLVAELQNYRNLTSEKRMFLLVFIGFVAFLIIAAAMDHIAEQTVGYYYCHSAPVITSSLLVYWIVGLGTLGGSLFYTRKDFTFTDFRKEIFYLIAYGLVLGVLYILLVEVSPDGDQFLSFALIIALIPNLYQFFAVFRPCLLTFPFLQKAKDEEGLAPLSEVIITQKGFAWFLEFCVDEFSQESPLCWKAIELFKVKTSFPAMKDIYSKYFAPNAPLAVNLSARSLRDLQTTCSTITEDTPLQELQSIFNLAQIELLQLMQEDSYFRFIGSQHYQRFRKGERVPHRYESGASGGSDGSSGHGSIGNKSGTAAGGSVQNASRSGDRDRSTHPLTEMVSSGGSKVERVSSGGSKIESKNAVVDPLTGGWMFDIDEESAKPGGSPSSPPRSPRSEDGGARSTETSPMPENEEEALKNSLVFTSNPLRRPSYV